MNIEKAIEKAIEGGWKPIKQNDEMADLYRTFLDPQFWQALFGKELVNANGESHDDYLKMDDHGWHDSGRKEEKWLYQWHKFLDFLAEGGTIEDYFSKLN